MGIDLVKYDPEDIIPHPTEQLGGTWWWRHVHRLIFDAIEWLAISGQDRSALPVTDYLGSLLCLACVWWSNAEREWTGESRTKAFGQNIILMLIESGSDMHYRDRHGRTPLKNLARSLNPVLVMESEVLSTYFGLLEKGQVDICRYLERESILNPAPIELLDQDDRVGSHYAHIRPRRITKSLLEPGFNSGNIISIDLKSSGLQLLEHFNFNPDVYLEAGSYCEHAMVCIKALGLDCLSQWIDLKSIDELLNACDSRLRDTEGDESGHDRERERWSPLDEIDYHIANGRFEKAAKIVARLPLCTCDVNGNYIELWPFYGGTHTMCQSGNKLGQPCLSPKTGWCETHSCRFNHARFARKQEKKQLKMLRPMGLKPMKRTMPGTWVE